MPDSCDIASGVWADRNHNGIPDLCEHGQEERPTPVGGEEDGGGMSCAPTPEDLDAAWAALDAWCAAQAWGPGSGLTGAEQYQPYVDKLCELGLIETSP